MGGAMSREAIFEASVQYFLSPIGAYLQDASVSEIMVNRFDQIHIERRGRLERTDARFESEDALVSAIHNVAQWVGREINPEHPILDARLPDGSRVNAVIPPASRQGTCLTIRRFAAGGLTMNDLIGFGTLSEEACEFLELCVRLKKNVLISGGTGTGKTSLLGAVSAAIPQEERIVVIEDTSELKLRQSHCLYFEVQQPDQFGRGGVNIRELFRASLRMRPDRVVVGEVRGGEALDMIQAMLSGHSGSLSTIHANSPRDALVRLETLSLMSDVQIPVYVARAQVASAIHLVVQLDRFSQDGSRRVTRVSEVTGLDDREQYRVQDLFAIRMSGKTSDGQLQGGLAATGQRPSFAQEPYRHGMDERIVHSRNLWSPVFTEEAEAANSRI
jgi:pilus assembly protein CpaF